MRTSSVTEIGVTVFMGVGVSTGVVVTGVVVTGVAVCVVVG
jgi:hypothetical protein